MNATMGNMPLFQRVKETIMTQIHSGELKPTDRVPSENELVKSMNISRMTANRALRELTTEGFIHRVPGVGRFVADPKTKGHLLEIRNIADEIRERKHHYQAEILILQEEKVGGRTAEWLQMKPNSTVFHSVILHRENGEAIQLEDRYVNPKTAPDYLALDFTVKTPHEHLMEVAPLQEAEHLVQAEIPDPETRRLLKMSEQEPCLVLYRRTWAAGILASGVRLQHPGDRFALAETFKPTAHPWNTETHERLENDR